MAASFDLPQLLQGYEAAARQKNAQAYLFDVKTDYSPSQSPSFLYPRAGYVEPGNDIRYLLVETVNSQPYLETGVPFITSPPPGGAATIFYHPTPPGPEAAELHPELKGWDLKSEWIDAAITASGLPFTGYESVDITTVIRLKHSSVIGADVAKALSGLADDAPVAFISSQVGAPLFGIGHAPYVVIDATTTGALLLKGTYPVYPPRPMPPGAVHSGG